MGSPDLWQYVNSRLSDFSYIKQTDDCDWLLDVASETGETGFIPAINDERSPFCLLCQQSLTNESMKPGRLELHLKAIHSAYVNSDLNYLRSLKDKFSKRSTIKSLFTTQTVSVSRTLEASNEMSLLIDK